MIGISAKIRSLSAKIFFPRGVWKKLLALVLTLAILLPIALYFSTQQASAAWFDDNWSFRKAITLTNTTGESNKYATLSNYDASDTTKYQTDCGDIRFTKQNGDLLPYTVDTCDSTTNFHIEFDSLAASSTQTVYIYFGNSTASDGFMAADRFSACADCTFGTPASEEKGPGPTLYWKFDDPAVSSVIQDSTVNGLDGTLNNTPTWQMEDQCITGKCYYFNGTANMNVSKSDDANLDFVAADNFTIQAWVKRNGTSSAVNYIITKAQSGYTGYKLYQDASGDYCFDVSDDTNTDTACTSAVEFDDDQWHFVQGVKAATTSITLYVDGKQRAQDAYLCYWNFGQYWYFLCWGGFGWYQ